jgi:60 kDa SS-A/Ro ribonucleoprotein
MPRDPLAAISAVATPQTQPIPGRTDQVRNNAGGYVYAKDLWTKAEDFLILGTSGGTYYLGEDRLTAQNADVIFQAIREDGPRLVRLACDVTVGRPPRAPKPRPALFALAAAHAQGDPATRQAFKTAFAEMVRTTDHLAMVFGYGKQLGGKSTPRGTAPVTGRSLRSAYASWFDGSDVNKVARKALKGMQRKTPAGEALALRDVLRIAHPKASGAEWAALFGWLAGNADDGQARECVREINSYLAARDVTTEEQARFMVVHRRVPWEYLPSEMLKHPGVWEDLAETAGLGALIRNLARMTRLGTLAPFAAANATVTRRLTDPAELAAARIHPMDAWLALRVYLSGRSQPDPRKQPQTWTPVPAITDALEEAFYLSFVHVEPTGKRLLVAVDSSGSMGGGWWSQGLSYHGSPLGTPYEVANTMALILMRTEPNVHVIDLDVTIHPSKITRRTNLREIARSGPSGGGTDLSLPFVYAAQYGVAMDGVIILTDGETWAGHQHPSQALDSYRRRYNPDLRVVVAAMAAVGHTIGEPGDTGVLNVAGMDAALPRLVTSFVRGGDGVAEAAA